MELTHPTPPAHGGRLPCRCLGCKCNVGQRRHIAINVIDMEKPAAQQTPESNGRGSISRVRLTMTCCVCGPSIHRNRPTTIMRERETELSRHAANAGIRRRIANLLVRRGSRGRKMTSRQPMFAARNAIPNCRWAASCHVIDSSSWRPVEL